MSWRRRGHIDRPLPLLGRPEADALLQFPRAKLRLACEARGLAVPPRASRDELAHLLIRDADRAKAERAYGEAQLPFAARDLEYPLLGELMQEHGLRHVLDLGCGPGRFADYVLRSGVLPEGGSYLGVDNVTGAIELARRRFTGAQRVRFEVGDLAGELPRAPRIDGVLLAFVLPNLDTHTADRLLRRLARTWPHATLLVAISLDATLNGPERPPSPRLARRFLKGDRRALARWDTRRLLCYTRAVDDHFGIVEEHLYDHAPRLVWVARRA
jgi:SAM-dependent methyltransferase